MKYSCYLFFFVVCMSSTGCKSGSTTSSVIGPGNWTIKDPVRYDFDCKQVQAFEFCPTLTLGSNGSMLYVQLFADTTRPLLPKGPELYAKVITGNDTLTILERPMNDSLERINGCPFATWYFNAPGQGQAVTSLELGYKGNRMAWSFSAAVRLNP